MEQKWEKNREGEGSRMEKKKNEYKKGLWTSEEDKVLIDYAKIHGEGHWNSISKKTGLNRCGKSCRLRWMNYLNPGIRRGHFTDEELDLILRLHTLLGNRWSLIAGRIPGRTDNQIKNYWNTHLSKKFGSKKETRRRIAGGVTVTKNQDSSSAVNSEAKNSSFSCEFDSTSVHSDSQPHNLSSGITLNFPDQAASDRDPARAVMISEGYVTNSSLWVSEYDGLITEISGENSGCFMDLICGNSFNLDWSPL